MTLEDPPQPRAHRVLSNKMIWIGSAVVVLVAAVAVAGLLFTLGGGSPQDAARLDAIKTAASIVVGTGGAAALLLAARRQRSAELDLVHKERVALSAEHDAGERRVTELYTKAAEQLGSDKAAVRLAALYSLERLGQDNTGHRQTVINIICAYLRMPYTRPAPSPLKTATKDEKRDWQLQAEELQVRQTAQYLIYQHRQSSVPAKYWNVDTLDLAGADLEAADWNGIDLRGANLIRANLNAAVLSQANLSEARLSMASFGNTNLRDSILNRATLGLARLESADLSGASLVDAHMLDSNFRNAKLDNVDFSRSIMRVCTLVDVDLQTANLNEADLSYTVWSSKTLWPAALVKQVTNRSVRYPDKRFPEEIRYRIERPAAE